MCEQERGSADQCSLSSFHCRRYASAALPAALLGLAAEEAEEAGVVGAEEAASGSDGLRLEVDARRFRFVVCREDEEEGTAVVEAAELPAAATERAAAAGLGVGTGGCSFAFFLAAADGAGRGCACCSSFPFCCCTLRRLLALVMRVRALLCGVTTDDQRR